MLKIGPEPPFSSSPSRPSLIVGSLRQTRFSSSQFRRGLHLLPSRYFSVHTVHPSQLWSPSPRLPSDTISGVCLLTYSCSRLFTCRNHPGLAFLHLSVMFSTFSLSLMLSCLAWSLCVGHMSIYASSFPSLPVGSIGPAYSY